MRKSEADKLQPTERVYRYVWVGGRDWNVQELTVIRVNPRTVTVETNQGSRFRIMPADIAGRVSDYDEEARR